MRISDWSSDVCSSDLPLPAVLAVGLLAAILAISSLRWWLVGRAIGAPLPLKDCVSLMFIGGFFTQVLPTSIGGDAVRILLAGRRGLPYGKAFSGVVLARASGLLALVVRPEERRVGKGWVSTCRYRWL